MQEENKIELDSDLRDFILDYEDETDPENRILFGCEIYKEAAKKYDNIMPNEVLDILYQCFKGAVTHKEKYRVLQALISGPINDDIKEIPMTYIEDDDCDIRTYSFQILCRLRDPEHRDIVQSHLEQELEDLHPLFFWYCPCLHRII